MAKPNKLKTEETRMKAEVEKIAQILEEEGRPFTREEVERVLDEGGVEVKGGSADELVQEVLEEGTKRTLTVLDKAWELLGVSPYPEAESLLRGGGSIQMWWAKDKRREGYEVGVRLVDEAGKILVDDLYSPPMGFYSPEEFDLHFERGLVKIGTPSGTVVGKSRALFKGHDPEKLEGVIDTTYVLRPVLNAMGISDIRTALEEFSYLGNGEFEMHNGYIIAKDDDFWFLMRGTIFGDPKLDRALVSGDIVTLSFPGDVEVAFKVVLDAFWAEVDRLYIAHTRIRWGGENFTIGGGRALCRTLDKGDLTKAIQQRVGEEIERLEQGRHFSVVDCSLEMLTFLKAFVRHEDPFRALAEGKFDPHVKAELFLDM
jgi:hypothetical protein